MSHTESDPQTKNALQLKGVGKIYPLAGDNFWALRDISLDILAGQSVGIVGRNGAGKTTLLNIIAGTLAPTQGEVAICGKVLGLFNLGLGFQDELSGKENIFLNGALLGASRKELEEKLNVIIEFSELGDFINMPLGAYSQGMRLRLGFSIVANLDFDILLLDEVLAVGDALFQSKCFQRLAEFKRAEKTLIITTQDTALIERTCNQAALIDHGRLLFFGEPQEALNRYRELLNKEKFFVLTPPKSVLFEETKKWADDIGAWGEKVGAKEIEIEAVELIDKFGRKTDRVQSGGPLKIKVRFNARDTVSEPHFGVAIFREEGVYCYGPNTAFDGHRIPQIKKGKGKFTLFYPRVLLAPGKYKISVAIWDKNERVAFDYHNGCYELSVEGSSNRNKALLNIPFQLKPQSLMERFTDFQNKTGEPFDLSLLQDKWGQKIESPAVKFGALKISDSSGREKEIFSTGECVKFTVNFSEVNLLNKNTHFWLGLYRDDGVYCQGIHIPAAKRKDFQVKFPNLGLLPGGYKISLGAWDEQNKEFLLCHHGLYRFRMVFSREDHGTVYLEHNWRWVCP